MLSGQIAAQQRFNQGRCPFAAFEMPAVFRLMTTDFVGLRKDTSDQKGGETVGSLKIKKQRVIINFTGAINQIELGHTLFELSPIFPELKKFNRRAKKFSKGTFIQCPFHPGDSHPSFHYSAERNLFYCYGCHIHGSLIDYYKLRKNVSFYKALIDLANFFKVKLIFKNVYYKPDRYQPSLSEVLQKLQEHELSSPKPADGQNIFNEVPF